MLTVPVAVMGAPLENEGPVCPIDQAGGAATGLAKVMLSGPVAPAVLATSPTYVSEAASPPLLLFVVVVATGAHRDAEQEERRGRQAAERESGFGHGVLRGNGGVEHRVPDDQGPGSTAGD